MSDDAHRCWMCDQPYWRRVFSLAGDRAERFDAMLARPATDVPGLRELVTGPSIFDEPDDQATSARDD